jgi:hypothetical protein
MRCCIVYLASPTAARIRPGVDDRRRYDVLKFSLARTRMHLPTLPILVFHEDYTPEDIDGLAFAGAVFVKVDFSGHDDVYRPIHASKGYMMMCRFFSGGLQAHPALEPYTHFIRLDDDSYFTEPYLTETRIASYADRDYVYRSVFFESKPQQSLFDFTLQFLKRRGLAHFRLPALLATLHREGVLRGSSYTGKAPYNNFHCASRRLWAHPLIAEYLREIERVHGCLQHGWLDANIHAMIIWVLARQVSSLRIGEDTAFGYRHNVHISHPGTVHIMVGETLKFLPCEEEDTSPLVPFPRPARGTLTFATFANTGYMTTERIEAQARTVGAFDRILAYTETSFPDFFETHADFVSENPTGYGRWIWKPKVLQATLATMNEGDIVVYCDAGMYLNPRGHARFGDYLRALESPDKFAVVFSTQHYTADEFACPDAVALTFPDFYASSYRYCYAGVFLLKKTPESVALVDEWLSLCETYPLLRGESVRTHPTYRGGDADNGLWNLCLATQDAHLVRIYPDETNLWCQNGLQFYGCPDWESLKHCPFQCRRIRPV